MSSFWISTSASKEGLDLLPEPSGEVQPGANSRSHRARRYSAASGRCCVRRQWSRAERAGARNADSGYRKCVFRRSVAGQVSDVSGHGQAVDGRLRRNRIRKRRRSPVSHPREVEIVAPGQRRAQRRANRETVADFRSHREESPDVDPRQAGAIQQVRTRRIRPPPPAGWQAGLKPSSRLRLRQRACATTSSIARTFLHDKRLRILHADQVSKVFALSRDAIEQPSPCRIEFRNLAHVSRELGSEALHGLELLWKERRDVDDEGRPHIGIHGGVEDLLRAVRISRNEEVASVPPHSTPHNPASPRCSGPDVALPSREE